MHSLKLNPFCLSTKIYLMTPSMCLQVCLGMFDPMSSTESNTTCMCSFDLKVKYLHGASVQLQVPGVLKRLDQMYIPKYTLICRAW